MTLFLPFEEFVFPFFICFFLVYTKCHIRVPQQSLPFLSCAIHELMGYYYCLLFSHNLMASFNGRFMSLYLSTLILNQ